MGEWSGGSEMARPQRPLHHHHIHNDKERDARNIPFPSFFLKPTIVVIFFYIIFVIIQSIFSFHFFIFQGVLDSWSSQCLVVV